MASFINSLNIVKNKTRKNVRIPAMLLFCMPEMLPPQKCIRFQNLLPYLHYFRALGTRRCCRSRHTSSYVLHVLITYVRKLALRHPPVRKFVPNFANIGQLVSEYEMAHAQPAWLPHTSTFPLQTESKLTVSSLKFR